MRKENYQFVIKFTVMMTVFIAFYMNFKIVIVNGDSMLPTYHNHQILFSLRNKTTISKNDVIIFRDNDGDICIKRVVACGGDTVLLESGHVYVNKTKLMNYTYLGEKKKYHLSGKEYFVIGDNDLNSIDSRTYGPIKEEHIVSVVLKRNEG